MTSSERVGTARLANEAGQAEEASSRATQQVCVTRSRALASVQTDLTQCQLDETRRVAAADSDGNSTSIDTRCAGIE